MNWYDTPFMVGDVDASDVRRALVATGQHDLVESLDTSINALIAQPDGSVKTSVTESLVSCLRISDVVARGNRSKFARRE